MGRRVLVLGAGINGAALARELVLNGVDVDVVDEGDLCSGTSAYSTRLIHGGLRYLEYRELDLVREALAERNRWLLLAPHLVRPLRLFIPATTRLGGLVGVARRFFHLESAQAALSAPRRGLWLIRLGLLTYDRFAGQGPLPAHACHRIGEPGTPPLPADRYIGLCSYYDAQLVYVERFVLALMRDAEQIARQRGVALRVRTYAQVERRGKGFVVRCGATSSDEEYVEPDAVVNATGPWVDRTLSRLGLERQRLLGGTKGSHLGLFHSELRGALQWGGVYAEAVDGRPFFVLPFGEAVLVGTTDVPYDGDPRDAVPDEQEVDYLLASLNRVFPQFAVTRDDVGFFYCGVRPLPRSEGRFPGAVTRRHFVHVHTEAPRPTFSLIGGKLTVCRALAEKAARMVLEALGVPVRAHSRQRPLPGAVADAAGLAASERDVAARLSPSPMAEQTAAKLVAWYGADATGLPLPQGNADYRQVAGGFPHSLVRWMICNEWVTRLEDLVARRLLLVFEPRLERRTLQELAQLMVACGRLRPEALEREVSSVVAVLEKRYGRRDLSNTSQGPDGRR